MDTLQTISPVVNTISTLPSPHHTSCVCRTCNIRFTVKTSDFTRGGGKYCSQLCYIQWRTVISPRSSKCVVKYCKVCGKSKKVKPSHVKYEGSYCSLVCRGIDQSTRQLGCANANYRGGISLSPTYRRDMGRKWYKNNPEKASISSRDQKLRRRGLKTGRFYIRDISRLLTRQEGHCVYCQCDITNKFTVDHIIPVSRGGTNFCGNLQLACNSCNSRKGRQTHFEFITRLRRGTQHLNHLGINDPAMNAVLAMNTKGSV